MTREEAVDKIKRIIKQVYPDYKNAQFSEYEDEKLFNLPQLREIVIKLLTIYYPNFIERTDWVSPKPMMFRINLKNGMFFYLIYNNPSWTAVIQSKRYNLDRISELQLACNSLSNILKSQSSPEKKDEEA